MLSASVGSVSPERIWPSRMRAVIVFTRPSARLRGRRGIAAWVGVSIGSRVIPRGGDLTEDAGLTTIWAGCTTTDNVHQAMVDCSKTTGDVHQGAPNALHTAARLADADPLSSAVAHRRRRGLGSC